MTKLPKLGGTSTITDKQIGQWEGACAELVKSQHALERDWSEVLPKRGDMEAVTPFVGRWLDLLLQYAQVLDDINAHQRRAADWFKLDDAHMHQTLDKTLAALDLFWDLPLQCVTTREVSTSTQRDPVAFLTPEARRVLIEAERKQADRKRENVVE